ncbi:unnamed protein product [Penicillium camemberti]|uniref:Str. FM013 n=1 Tax=Penicillium camemberti (strain FM 013) TaxID=1429867 RepID=A0A0G4PJP9_PENC3|nr:unnamed protein product [Penicillium camemberti]
MSSEKPVEERVAENESASTNQPPTRRKQHRSQPSHFARKLRRAGLEVPELPKGDEPKAKVSRQAKRRLNKRMRRAAAAAATTAAAITTTTAAAAPSPPIPEQESRVMAGSPKSKKDGDKPLDFGQPLTFRPKKGTTVVESHSHDLTLALRPKKGPA